MFDITLPISGIAVSWPLLLCIGASVGVLSGFFGVGGGWIVTPALLLLGMDETIAVGTGLAYICGTASLSAWKHRQSGNVEIKLSLVLGGCMIIGVEIGKHILIALTAHGLSGPVLRILYVVMLLSIGLIMLVEAWRNNASEPDETATKPLAFGQRLRLPPMLKLRDTNQSLSFWLLLGCGLIVGCFAGVLGVGGGFLLMPLMVYIMGLPTVVAVGSSLLSLMLTSFYGSISYASFGQVELVAAAIMFGAAVAGAPWGVRASKNIKAELLRLLYAIMTLLGGSAVLLDFLHYGSAARWLLFGAAIGMTFVILGWSCLTRRAAPLALT